MILYIYGVCTLLSIIICTYYILYTHHCNPSTIASIYTIIPLPIKLITQHWETLGDATMTFKPQHLIMLMDAFRRHPCTVKHDNVYALLGLADLKPGSLKVDYYCSIEDLARAVWAAMKDDFEGHEVDNCILYTLQITDRENFSLEPQGYVNKILDRLKGWWRTEPH